MYPPGTEHTVGRLETKQKFLSSLKLLRRQRFGEGERRRLGSSVMIGAHEKLLLMLAGIAFISIRKDTGS